MQKIITFFFILAFAPAVFGLPLVFKTTKEIKESSSTELLVFDTSKYKQVRIGVKLVIEGESEKIAQVDFKQLLQKRAELKDELDKLKAVYNDRHPDVISKQKEVDKINSEIEKTSNIIESNIRIEALEENDSVFIETFFIHKNFPSRSIFINSPPSKIKISADRAGTYKIYIWAE